MSQIVITKTMVIEHDNMTYIFKRKSEYGICSACKLNRRCEVGVFYDDPVQKFCKSNDSHIELMDYICTEVRDGRY